MNEFQIVKEMKKFIMLLDDTVINIPKKDYVIKNRLYDDSLDILELIYLANNSLDKKVIQIKIISKISMLDFYLEHSYLKKYISQKDYLSKSGQLNKITKMVYEWLNGS